MFQYKQVMLVNAPLNKPFRLVTGLTLLEIVVSLAILGILTTVAIPGMVTMLDNRQLASNAESIVRVLSYARSEAILRRQPVSLCLTLNNTACSSTAGWKDGRIVFTDANGDGAVDSGDTVIRVEEGVGERMVITAPDSVFTYAAHGKLTSSSGSISVCSSSLASQHVITVPPIGSPRISEKYQTNNC